MDRGTSSTPKQNLCQQAQYVAAVQGTSQPRKRAKAEAPKKPVVERVEPERAESLQDEMDEGQEEEEEEQKQDEEEEVEPDEPPQKTKAK